MSGKADPCCEPSVIESQPIPSRDDAVVEIYARLRPGCALEPSRTRLTQKRNTFYLCRRKY